MSKSWKVWGAFNESVPALHAMFYSREACEIVWPEESISEFTLRPGPDPVPELVDALKRIAAHDSTTCDGITPRDCVETMREIARAVLTKHTQPKEET